MKKNLLTRLLPMLLCTSLCACAATPAAASAEPFFVNTEQLAAMPFALELTAPTDWSRDSAAVSAAITDHNGTGFVSAEVKVGRDGSWKNITNDLTQSGGKYTGAIQVTENGPVILRVTGRDGTTAENTCTVRCFDWSAPTVRAVASDGKLYIEARDNRSGIASIHVDGKEYAASDDKDDKNMSITVDKLDAAKEQVTVRAVDRAGNQSDAAAVDNPSYQPPETEQEDTEKQVQVPTPGATPLSTTAQLFAVPKQMMVSSQASGGADTSVSENSVVSTGASASASTDPEAGTDTAPQGNGAFTIDGQGTVLDNATEDEGKEFYTITTADDKVFYLIVDKQRDSENVYFLSTVTEEELLALAESSEAGSESAVPDPAPVCTCEVKCEAGAVDMDCPVCTLSLTDCTGKAPEQTEEVPDETAQESSGAGLYVVIVLVMLAAGGAGWYFKIYKPKHDLDDAEDFDELVGEEETVNEDEPEDNYPDEPDYYDSSDDEPKEPGIDAK